MLAHIVNCEAEHRDVRVCQRQSRVGRDCAVHGKGERRRLGLLTIRSVTEKTLSAGRDVMGMHRYFLARTTGQFLVS